MYYHGCNVDCDDGTVISYYAHGWQTVSLWIVPGTWVEPEHETEE